MCCSCFTSPLPRARQFTDIVWQNRGSKPIELQPLKEAHLGYLQGMLNCAALWHSQNAELSGLVSRACYTRACLCASEAACRWYVLQTRAQQSLQQSLIGCRALQLWRQKSTQTRSTPGGKRRPSLRSMASSQWTSSLMRLRTCGEVCLW